eukprot:UN31381
MSVITTGGEYAYPGSWVTSYDVEFYDEDTDTWVSVNQTPLLGNTDATTEVKNTFSEPVSAQKIRVLPKTWVEILALSVAVEVCEHEPTTSPTTTPTHSPTTSPTSVPS